MRKTLLSSFVILSLSVMGLQESHAGSLDGAYVSLGTGIQTNQWSTENVLGSNLRTTQGSIGESANISLGYGLTAGRVYYGAEETYEYSNSQAQVRIPHIYDMTMGMRHNFDLSAKLGYLIQPNFMFYGTTGWAYSNGYISASGTPTYDFWKSGVKFGLGAEYAIDMQTFIRADYDYTYFGDINPNGNNGGTYMPNRSGVRLGLGFRF